MATLQATMIKTRTWFKRRIGRLLEQRWFHLGLRAKMGALVTIGLLGLMTIFGLLAVSSAREATQQALNERLIQTRMSAEALDIMLLHIVDDLSLIAQLPMSETIDGSLNNQDESLNQLSVFHQPIYYIKSTGDVIGNSKSSPPSIPWDEIPAVQFALEGQTTNISNWSQYQPGTVVIAIPTRDSSGHITGALAVLLDLSESDIFPIKSNFEFNHTGVIDLVDQDGQIVYSSQGGRVRENLTEELILTQLFHKRQGGVETCLGCPGTKPEELSDEVVSFAPLSSVPLGVVIRQPAEEVFSSVRRLFVWHTLMGLISMVGAFGLVWATTNSVIDPLKTLDDAAQRITRGDLDTPTGPLLESWPSRHPRRDEIGTLGKSFDRMRLRLKDSNDEVQALNRDLDARVQERTAQAIAAQKEAQMARDDLQAIIDALSDELIVINVDDHRIVQVNQACREKNKGLGDITKLSCFELFQDGHPCKPPNRACPLEDVVDNGEPARVTHIRTGPGETQPAYLDIIASPLRDGQGKITRIVEMVRDVTEERQVSESLVRRNQQLAILNEVATTVSQSLNIEDILGRALDEVIQRTGVDVGAVFLIEDILGELNLIAHRGLSEEAARVIAKMGMLDGSCGGVVEHGQVVVVPDISRFRGHRARTLRQEKLITLVHVPLTSKGSTLGSMCVGTRQKKEFGVSEQDMLVAIGNQIAVAIDNARLYAEVQQKEQVRKEFFRKAINAQEDERKRIARELHDDTSQALTALLFAAEEGLEMSNLGEVKTSLERMHNLTRQTLDGVHKLLYDLRPSMLDHLGLIPALRWFAKSTLEPKEVRVNFLEDQQSCRFSSEIEIALFRVFQEAITNITRHAAARNVYIYFELTPDQARIEIKDDGIGFDPSRLIPIPDTERGLGLLGMRERLDLLGGEFEITSIPGQGTSIDIRVPLNRDKRRLPLA